MAFEEAAAIEGRDWIGNPDGTLVYWQREADEARAKLAAIEDLCNAAVQHSEQSPSRLFSGEPFPALLTAVGVLGILHAHDDSAAVARWNTEERSGIHD